MKKLVTVLTFCFCMGLLGLHAKTEFKPEFNDYSSAAEKYSASKVFASSASDNSEEGALRGAPTKPSEPGPVGTGLGIISLCSCAYILFQLLKKNKKTI